MSESGRRFREILAAPGITVLPGVFNGFSARLVQDMGYQAAAISGAGISESLLGWADRTGSASNRRRWEYSSCRRVNCMQLSAEP